MSRVLILGGAGFLGRHIAHRFVEGGARVVIVDGCFEHTQPLSDSLQSGVRLIAEPVETVEDLPALLGESEVIVDAMGWTRHRAALQQPLLDLERNVGSHLHVLESLPEGCAARFIYLGSRGQYGNTADLEITEETPMNPQDVQGVHKLAGELHYKLFSGLRGFSAASLRLPNCFGPGQPVHGEDIGLAGLFIRDIVQDRPIEVYGTGRRRAFEFAPDVAEVVWQLSRHESNGFEAYNLAGRDLAVDAFAECCIECAGEGRLVRHDVPSEVAAIDMGNAVMDESKLRGTLRSIARTELETAMKETVRYFREALR